MKIAKELKHKRDELTELLEIMKNASIHFGNLIKSGKLKNKISIISGTASDTGSSVAVNVAYEKVNITIVYLPEDISNKNNYVLAEKKVKKYLPLNEEIRDKKYINNKNLDMPVDNGNRQLPVNTNNQSNPDLIRDSLIELNPLAMFNSTQITNRQRQVIELIADGSSNKEIALKLNLSTYTVKSHVHSILEKLSLSTRMQIARYAYLSKYYKIAI